MKQRGWLIALVLILAAVLLIAATTSPYTVIVLKANQSVMAQCQGDEFIITPYGDTEVELTCRVWLREGGRRP